MNGMKLAASLACILAVACTQGSFKPRYTAPLAGPVTDLDKELAVAKQHYKMGNVALALQHFRRVLRNSPDHPAALNGLAICYDVMGRFDLSRRYYELAMAAAPADQKVRHNFAVSLRMQGDEQAAAALRAEAAPPPAPAARPASPEAVSARLAEAAAPPPLPAPAASVTVQLPPAVPLALPAAVRAVPPAQARVAAQLPAPAASVTIELPPAPSIRSSRREPVRTLRLERLSLGEIALVTRSIQERLATRVRPGAAHPKSGQAMALASQQIRILNAVGRRGLAGRVTNYLTVRGWPRAAASDASAPRRSSLIVYPAGKAQAARRLAGSLPFHPRIERSSRVSQLVLMLGQDSVAFDNSLRGKGRRS